MSFKRKIFLIILCVACAACAVALSACSSCTRNEDEISYKLNSDKKSYCVSYVGKNLSNVQIQSTYKGKPVTRIADGAFHRRYGFMAPRPHFYITLTLPVSVTQIDDGAFEESNNTIYDIFYLGTLSDWLAIDFDDTLITRDTQLFIGGELVERVVIPEGTVRVNKNAFANYVYLREVTLDGVKIIDDGAFYKCVNLSDISFPDSLVEIGEQAFYGCKSFTEVTLGNGVTEIEEEAFAYCTGIESMTVGDGVTELEDGVFKGCNFKKVTLGTGITKTDGELKSCINLTELNAYGLTEIEENEFENFNSLLTVNAPRLKSVADGGFNGCESLNTVNAIGLERVGRGAFANCENLTAIDLTSLIYTIPEEAFLNCGFTDLIISAYVQSIGTDAFGNCKCLKTVEWRPAYCDAPFAFHGCENIEEVTFSEGVRAIPDHVFVSNQKIKTLILPQSLVKIGMNAFGSPELDEVTFPSKLESIGSFAFSFCNLKTVALPASLKEIDGSVFSRNDNLEEITVSHENTFLRSEDNKIIRISDNTLLVGTADGQVPDGITAIGDYAYYYCYSLTNISLPDSVTKIGKSAFSRTSLKDVILPDSITLIDDSAFDSCFIESIILPSGLVEIGQSAFDSCKSLKQITIPASVKKIDLLAFRDCDGLESITFEQPEGWYAFDEGEGTREYLTFLADPVKTMQYLTSSGRWFTLYRD
ncbi:MAG: leucine-rich repeat domain-containing protein [Clostridia bacterium]|nr:leucine-rich repeat domain-containing protein [Clostridia bacterium]